MEKEDAETIVSKETEDPRVPTMPDPLISEILPAFLEYLRVEEQRADTTISRYTTYMHRFINEVGDIRVSAIDSEKLSYFKRRLMDAGLSPGSIATTLSGLRTFLRYVRNERRLATYDHEKVRRPKIPKREVDYLTKEEVQRFVDAIPTHTFVGIRDRALVELLYSSGMRISEALSLDRGQIDWEAKEARIIGKGRKMRKVYFSDAALDWLQRYLRHRLDDFPALFMTNGGNEVRLKSEGTWKRFRRYAIKAGIAKHVYPHMLRHTMATTLLANGCPIGHIRVMLGHEHLTTTCKYYLGLISDAEAKAAHEKYISYQDESEQDGAGEHDIPHH